MLGFPFVCRKKKLITLDAIVIAYVINTYGEHTSSAMAATRVIKSLTAFLFTLFAPSMYQALRYGWTNSILALVGFIFAVPLPIFV